MNIDYPIHLYLDTKNEKHYWVAEYLDLPGCIGVGQTKQEAIEEAEVFKEMWLETAVDSGASIPLPSDILSKEYSGKFNLRVSKDVHRKLVIQAENQGVSLNTLCSGYLERGLEQDKFFASLTLETSTVALNVTPPVVVSSKPVNWSQCGNSFRRSQSA